MGGGEKKMTDTFEKKLAFSSRTIPLTACN